MEPAMPCKGWFISESRKWCRAMTKQRISKQCMVVQWNSHQSTRQRVECSLLTKHEDRIAGNGFFFDTLPFDAQVYPRCHKRWRFRMQKLQWKRNGRRSKRFQLGSWTKSSAKSRLFWKHKETKQVFFATLMDMCRFKKCGVRTQNFRSTKADSCSAWTL